MKPASIQYKLLLLLAYAPAYYLFYTYPNLHPPVEPVFLPLMTMDLLTPLVPWTFIIYVSTYLLSLTCIVITDEVEKFQRLTRLGFMVLIICGTFYWMYPTAYPRPAYPDTGSAFVNYVMNVVGNNDTPNNCFPSHHVSATCAMIWGVRDRSRKIVWPLCLWAIAIFISTLTTKQHYFLDILGGFGVAGTAAMIEWAVFEKGLWRRLKPSI